MRVEERVEKMTQEVSARVTTVRSGQVAGQALRQQGSADILATVVASVAIALPLVFYLHQHVEILRLGYEIESREASLGRVEEQAALMGLSAPPASNIYLASSPMAAGGESATIAAAECEQSVVARLE